MLDHIIQSARRLLDRRRLVWGRRALARPGEMCSYLQICPRFMESPFAGGYLVCSCCRTESSSASAFILGRISFGTLVRFSSTLYSLFRPLAEETSWCAASRSSAEGWRRMSGVSGAKACDGLEGSIPARMASMPAPVLIGSLSQA
jgi:hypothetical protein